MPVSGMANTVESRGDAVAAMHRHADAAAHHHAMQQRDIGLGKVLDGGVENVFVAVEIQRIRRARLAGFVQRANVAAGAECAVAIAADDDRGDIVVLRPDAELFGHGKAHAMRERVQRLGPVQRDEAQRAALVEEDFRFIRHCRNISRATITRMISLVPSNIW